MNPSESKKDEIEDETLEGEETYLSKDYPFSQIKIDKDQFSLFELKRKFEDKNRQDILIDPDFQRNFVWSYVQKSELIESILMGIPLPVIYLFEQADGKKQVVDGRQRLTSIFSFMNNEFALTELKILNDESTKKFEKLNPLLQAKIEDYQIQAYLIKPPTPERIKFDIFDRVNRSGTQLNHQEMRNALHQGKSTRLIKELAETLEFKEATGNAITDKRMKGRYIIIRFLSFYMLQMGWLKEEKIEYKSDIDDFLSKTMMYINAMTDEYIQELRDTFLKAMKRSYRILGSDGFRFTKRTDEGNRRPINMALFEALTYLFTHDFIDSAKPENLKTEIESLKTKFDNQGFSQQVDSSTKVEERFAGVSRFVKEYYHD
ncbi:MAG: DUF262 domain-containing protein [Fibrobacter sp.]|jgi:uncharacterized protein with ParB-like and HNH nuclease domain|nr:DUF262 domain-containing protein [Fibrobacter sp.]